MGYGYYRLTDGREAGYCVDAECDATGCGAEINRGLGYLCGENPEGHNRPGEYGCHNYYCEKHLYAHDCPNPDSSDDEEE